MKALQRSNPKHLTNVQKGESALFFVLVLTLQFSKVSGHGYMSDRSASTGISETRKKDKVGSLDSLAQSVQDGKSWNQNRAYFLRTGDYSYLLDMILKKFYNN